MKSEILGRLAWRSAGALLALSVLSLASPPTARAQASCSHYVLSQDQPAIDLSHYEELFQSAAAVPPGDGVNRDASGKPSPCPGGICSRGAELPPMPVPDPVRIEEWGTLTTLVPTPDSGAIAFPFDEDTLRPIHQGDSVFHPPRLLSSPIAS